MLDNDADARRGDVNHFLIPPGLRLRLLTEGTVKNALIRKHDPIIMSLVKWRNILHVTAEIGREVLPSWFYRDLHRFIGYKTCALCLSSIEKYTSQQGELRTSYDKCTVCPLAQLDQCTKPDSVYAKIDTLLQSREGKPDGASSFQNQLLENCDAMFRNLRKLIDI